MSIIIKGIDLPVNDRYTTLRIYKNGHIWLGKTLVGIAIQIPKGHGRIGDLDELQVNVIKAMTYGDALHEIKKAPIILESEEE